MPFLCIKKIMEKKGYTINIYSSKTHSNKVSNYKYRETPIEIFELEIQIIDNPKSLINESGKKRKRDGEQ
jgi:hypothetical protein